MRTSQETRAELKLLFPDLTEDDLGRLEVVNSQTILDWAEERKKATPGLGEVGADLRAVRDAADLFLHEVKPIRIDTTPPAQSVDRRKTLSGSFQSSVQEARYSSGIVVAL